MKKALIIFFVLVVIFLVIIFGFKACQKDEPYRNVFVDANIEYGCFLYNNPGIEENGAVLESQLTEIYKKNGLPVEDDQLMREILDLYENNGEIFKAVNVGMAGC